MEHKKWKLTAQQAADILLGRSVLTSEAERRQALTEIAQMVIFLREQNELLTERCYQLEERIAIMTEGVVNDG